MEYSRNLSLQFYCLVDNQVYFGICYIRLSMMPSKSRCFFVRGLRMGKPQKTEGQIVTGLPILHNSATPIIVQ